MTYLLRWASPDGHMGMPLIADMERDGWRPIGRDPRYPSVLMRRDVDAPAEVPAA